MERLGDIVFYAIYYALCVVGVWLLWNMVAEKLGLPRLTVVEASVLFGLVRLLVGAERLDR